MNRPHTLPAAQASWLSRLAARRGVSRQALAGVARGLAVLVGARLPLLDALETVSWQAGTVRLRAILEHVCIDVRRGRSLSDSLGRHPAVFDSLFVHLVRVGEQTGRLGVMLERIAQYHEKSAALRRQIRLALVYPGVVLAVAVGVVGFLLHVLVPAFAGMYADFGAELPVPTRVVLGASDLLRERAGSVAGVVVLLALAGHRLGMTERGRHWQERIVLHLPLVGVWIRRSLSARFCRTMGTLLQGGVHLLDALHLLTRSAGGSPFDALLRQMVTSVTRGGTLAEPLRGNTLLPEVVVQMIALGEATARLDDLLLQAAGHVEAEVDAGVEALTAVIEPVLIVVLGVIIGGILVAMYLPLFELNAVIR